MCKSSEVSRIDHGLDYPNSNLDVDGRPRLVSCKWCGKEFEAEEPDQEFCSGRCFCVHYGLPMHEEY